MENRKHRDLKDRVIADVFLYVAERMNLSSEKEDVEKNIEAVYGFMILNVLSEQTFWEMGIENETDLLEAIMNNPILSYD